MYDLVSDRTKEERYLGCRGLKCPFCLSRDITARPPSTDAMEAWAQVSCDECHAEWNDLYTLTGIEITLGPSNE